MKQTLFLSLAHVYEQLENITSGNAIRELLSGFFRKLPKKDVPVVAQLTLGKIVPDYVDINVGMAEKMVLKALHAATNVSLERIVMLYKKEGDVGIVASHVVGMQKKRLRVVDVFDTLHCIARVQGAGSQEKKQKLLAGLFVAASPLEARYIARIVAAQLRLGVGDKTVLGSLARAFTGSRDAKKVLERAYVVCPDIAIIARVLVSAGIKGVARIRIDVGRPIQMMLAQRVERMSELQEKISGMIAAEEKYDGERVQVHAKNGVVTLFSRRLENITHQFPDVVAALKKSVRAKTFIVEGEIVPVDAKGNLLPFQTLMQRRRKHGVESFIVKVPIHVYVFDVLLAGTKSYLDVSYPKRRAVLEEIVCEQGIVHLARRVVSQDIGVVEDFFNQVLERGCEGIVAKSCASNAFYTPGARGWLWIKWKREYQKELADTFDLVVVGAFAGRGRRKGVYGALLCAVYDEKKDVFETFCKLGTGFSDKDLAVLPKKFPAVKQKPKNVVVAPSMKPDVWVAPQCVVEVLGAEITKSPLHTAAGGLALRFPRFIRYRKDKSARQATTSEEVRRMIKNKK